MADADDPLPAQQERASLEDMDRAPSSVPATLPVDWQAQHEALRFRFQQLSDEHEKLKQINADLLKGRSTIDELDKLIGPSAKAAFRYMSVYSVGAFTLLLLDGSHVNDFDLDPGVLQLLVGSTAATVLGLVGMVLTGIFVGARKVVNDRREG